MIDPADLTSYLRRSKMRPVQTGADAPDLAPDNSAAERQAAISARPVAPAPEGLGSSIVKAISQVGSAAITRHYEDAAAKSQAPKLEYNTAANPFQKTNVPRGEAGLDFTRPRMNQGRQLNTGMMPMFAQGGTLKRNGDAAIVGDAGPELAVKDEQGTHVLPLDRPYTPPRPTLTDVLARQPPQLGSVAPDTGAQPTAHLGSDINVDLVRRNFSPDGNASPNTPTPATRPRTVTPAPAPNVGQVKRADETLADQLRPAIGSSSLPNTPSTASAPSSSLDAQTRARRVVENPDPSLSPAGVAPAGVDFRPDEPASRGRIAEPVRRLNDQLNDELANPAHSNHKHKWLEVLEMAGVGALKGAASQPANPIAGAIGGAAAGGIVQGVRPDTLAQMRQGRRVARFEQQLDDVFDRQKKQLAVDETRADIGVKRANEKWLEARPDLEARKAADAAAQRERNAVLANLRLLKGQKLDPGNPRHARILERAANAGIEVDPDAWNDSASNLVPIDVVDPQNPTQKRRQFYNKATGDISDVGQSSYVAPIHKDTELTSNQEGLNADRDAARANLERQRGIQNKFSQLRVNQGAQRITLAQASQDHRFTQDERKELGAADKLRAESERFEQLANDADSRVRYFDKDAGEWKESKKWAEKRDEFKARAGSLRSQLYDTYGYLWSPDGQGTPQMTYDEFTRNHAALLGGGYREGNKIIPTTKDDVLAVARRLGVTITDADEPQRTLPAPGSAMPRRTAAPTASGVRPRAAAQRAQFTEQDVRDRAQKSGKDPDAAVKAARAAHLIP